MLSEDYIIRMIQMAVSALLRIAGLRKQGLYDEARAAVDLTLEQLLGLRASRARSLDDERLYFLLSREDSGGVLRLDTRRLALVADLFEVEGGLDSDQGRGAEGQAAYARALRYALEVFFQELEQFEEAGDQEGAPEGTVEDGPGDAERRVVGLIQKVDAGGLGPETLWPLAGYYEETGQFARAEAALARLAARPELRGDLLPELEAFYQRVLEQPDEALAAGGLERAGVQESLERLRRGK